ncbi:hypothetical protein [Streptomyces eurocidicus]|uniref:DNA-binding protein n=1 Tax=Streptomyces eurocidicus TaxID=66423 RepID=A0A7W8B732_STREU|nr:hypothetical protein [Streptomyces eurocidicus]MBB5117997.1 hypothetical protein [Streptomyces eurocidicus]MBF6053976.1 hypothetical protein [Streptomyces eurocidicus]
MLRHVIAPERFFSQVPNDIIRHPRLSAAAVRLLTWQLSLPGESETCLSETAEKAGIKKTAFIRAKRELMTEGYVHEWRRQSARGRWKTTQLVSNVPLSAEEAMALRDGFRPTAAVPAVGEPTGPAVGRHPHNTEENTYNPPSQPSREPEACDVPGPLVERGGLVIAAVSHRDRRLRLNGRDVQQLAALAGEWLLRGASVKELREALTDGLPERVHSPVALIRNRLVRKMPEAPPLGLPAPGPRPLRECAGGCERVFRPVGDETRCRDCRLEAAEAAEAAKARQAEGLPPSPGRSAQPVQPVRSARPVQPVQPVQPVVARLSASGAFPGSGPGSGPA